MFDVKSGAHCTDYFGQELPTYTERDQLTEMTFEYGQVYMKYRIPHYHYGKINSSNCTAENKNLKTKRMFIDSKKLYVLIITQILKLAHLHFKVPTECLSQNPSRSEAARLENVAYSVIISSSKP